MINRVMLWVFGCVMGFMFTSALCAADKPNIVLIFADDQATDTLAAWGHPHMHTPNLDRLSRRGVNFMYAHNAGSWTGAVCVPSRSMLNTGRSLWRAQEANSPDEAKRGTYWAQIMRAGGYETYMTGKWHLRADVNAVFDHVRHVRPGMANVQPNTHPEAYNRPREDAPDTWDPADPSRGGVWEGGRHWSEVIADDFEVFLADATERDKPFFMYLAFNAPHDPRQAPQQYLDLYPTAKMPALDNFLPQYPFAEKIGVPHSLRDEYLAPMPRTRHAIEVHRREYYAMVSHMDAQVGRILDALERSGEMNNTIIIFTADHGLAVGRHGLMGKQNLYEHSVRVPLIIVGPGMPQGKRIEQRVYYQDIVPTTMELAGIEPPEHIAFRSLMPLIDDASNEHYPAIYGAYIDKQRMVIEDEWKLLVYPGAGRIRLYNLRNDPAEMHDLSEHPEHAPRIKQLFTTLTRLQHEQADTLDLSATFAKWIE